MLGFFDKLTHKSEKKALPTVSSKTGTKGFRTALPILNAALTRWESERDIHAPLWLNYPTTDNAQDAKEELHSHYYLSRTQAVGTILIVDGDDAKMLVSIIKRIQREKSLETIVFNTLKDYTLTNQDTLITIPFADNTEASIAKRILDRNYRIREVLQDHHNLFITAKGAEYFLKHYNPLYASR